MDNKWNDVLREAIDRQNERAADGNKIDIVINITFNGATKTIRTKVGRDEAMSSIDINLDKEEQK